MNAQSPFRFLLLGLLLAVVATGCGSGYVRYDPETGARTTFGADIWYTILTAVVAFVVGFIVAAAMARDGGVRLSLRRHRHHRRTTAGWNRVRQDIQAGTAQALAEWRSAGHSEDADWAGLSRRIEERIVEAIRKHQD